MAGKSLTSKIFDQLNVGVVMVGADHRILACSQPFANWFAKNVGVSSNSPADLIGFDFYTTLGLNYFFEGDYAPFYYATAEKRTARTVFATFDPDDPQKESLAGFEPSLSSCDDFYSLCVTPIFEKDSVFYIAEISDISESSRTAKRLETLKSAGAELTEFTDGALGMKEEERIEKLKRLIERHMRDILLFDVVEIRILEPGPKKRLTPFLNFGLRPSAAQKELFVKSYDNGITGYVADSGEPYICDDVKNDGHYIEGAIDSRSSITVPLIFGKKLVGTCNVESQTPHAFSKQDETFLLLYAGHLATAIHLHLSISKNRRRLHGKYSREIREKLAQVVSDINSLTLNLSYDCARSDEVTEEMKKDAVSLDDKVQYLRSQISDLIFIFSAPDSENRDGLEMNVPRIYPDEWKTKWAKLPSEAQNAIERAIRFLFKRRVLVVSPVPLMSIDQLETLGCIVDVVDSTRRALQALERRDYDLILTLKHPDGKYIHEDDDIDVQNSHQKSLADLHDGESFFVPCENYEKDARTRERIRNEIEVQKKLDAYFFRLAIEELHLKKFPLFILVMPDDYYDATHIREYLSARVGFQQQMFVDEPIPVSILLCVKTTLDSVMSNDKRRDSDLNS